MRTACVAWPENDKLVMVRESAVDMCDGNQCAAALLSFFAYWHSIKLEQSRKAVIENQVAEAHGEAPTQNTKLWQFHTADDLVAGLLGLYGKSSIKAGVALLIEMGVIEAGRNPNPRYAFDNTKYFLFHPEVVNGWLRQYIDADRDLLKLTTSSVENNRPSIENNRRSAENNRRSIENNRTITEVTCEVTTEVSSLDHDHGDDERTTDDVQTTDPLITEIVDRRAKANGANGTAHATPSEALPVMEAVQAPSPQVSPDPLPVEHTIVASTATPAPYVPMKEAMARAQAVIDAAVKETTPSVVLPPVDPQIAALTKILTEVGVGVNSYTFDLYRDLAIEHGMPAVIAGIKIAAENGKQQSFKYVSACIVNAAKGTTNVSHKHTGSAGQAVNASGGGSGQGAGEATGRKPRRELDPAKVALFSGRSL